MAVSRPGRIRARLTVPPDKSISHRALIFNSIAAGTARIDRLLESDDVRATAACLRGLGVEIDWPEGSSTATVNGRGADGLEEPEDVLDCRNSGTTMRLLAGLLAARPGFAVLTGDASLRRRPMARIIEPLSRMGASLSARQGDTLPPIAVNGGGLNGIEIRTSVASAQVKTALLLAGLQADGETAVIEPAQSRDHSERMLAEMGAPLSRRSGRISVRRASTLAPLSLRVPGDISSAAPWLVLGVCHPDAEITLCGVGVNPTRTGLLEIMHAMGADLELSEERTVGGEPVADITVRSSTLHGAEVGGDAVPRAIDELPLVALLGSFARGDTVVRDASELRAKESDRVDAVVRVLRPLGAEIAPAADGFRVTGSRLRGAAVDAGLDHRIGMLAAVAGALADGETSVENDAVGVSYPGFWRDLAAAGAEVSG